MTEPRTVTLTTLDHGDVTLPEPDWCAGHANHVPVHRVDLTHYGPEHRFEFRGEQLWAVTLTQSPFVNHPYSRSTGILAEQSGYAHTLDPADLDSLAAVLVEHAEQLRVLARALAALLAGEGQ